MNQASPRHSLLQRQLRKFFPAGTSEQAVAFIEAVDLAYLQFDDDRRMLERSLDLSSQELMQANQQMRAIFEAVPDLFFRTTAGGRILEVKAGTAAHLHLPPAELVGRSIHAIPVPEVSRRFAEAIAAVAAQRTMTSIEYSLAVAHEVLHYEARFVPLRINDEIVVIVRDITPRKRAEESLVHDAIHDALTGLPNRTLFTDRLEHAILRSKRQLKHRFAVLFVDVDRFKVINDSLGHLAGDDVLVEVAARIRACIRPADTVARLGGDEFAILLDRVETTGDAIHAAERVQSVVSAPQSLHGSDVVTTVSIGIAVSTPHYSTPGELLRDADIAMYRAKAQGRAGHEVFHPGMHTTAVELLHLESALRRALERDELVLHYQPVVGLTDARILGFEALLRWNHPSRGMILPDQFVTLAEETGLIAPIGRWVMAEACRCMRQWQRRFDRPDLTISVNVSGRHLAQESFLEEVREVLSESGLVPHTLCLELTETVLMENSQRVLRTLGSLRGLGVQIHIDDFGTGYSSLSYLHRLPIDTLKIDRSFISHIETGDENLEIIRTIMALSASLRIQVIAEGVENEMQRAQLAVLRCHAAQGRLFSMPADESAVQTMIGSGHW